MEFAAVGIGLALAVLSVSWIWRTSARASIIERLERAMVSSQSRQDSQQGELDDLRNQIHELRDSLIVDHALLQEWIAYARRLGAMFREATGREPPPEPAARPRGASPGDLARLARTIENRFSLDEMNNLAFELGMDGVISGETVAARATALVTAARRRGLLIRLIELCRQERPDGGF